MAVSAARGRIRHALIAGRSARQSRDRVDVGEPGVVRDVLEDHAERGPLALVRQRLAVDRERPHRAQAVHGIRKDPHYIRSPASGVRPPLAAATASVISAPITPTAALFRLLQNLPHTTRAPWHRNEITVVRLCDHGQITY